MDFASGLARSAPYSVHVRVLGPAPAPLVLVRGRHRVRLLLHAARGINVPAVLGEWLASVKPGGGVRMVVDVDPYSFL